MRPTTVGGTLMGLALAVWYLSSSVGGPATPQQVPAAARFRLRDDGGRNGFGAAHGPFGGQARRDDRGDETVDDADDQPGPAAVNVKTGRRVQQLVPAATNAPGRRATPFPDVVPVRAQGDDNIDGYAGNEGDDAAVVEEEDEEAEGEVQENANDEDDNAADDDDDDQDNDPASNAAAETSSKRGHLQQFCY